MALFIVITQTIMNHYDHNQPTPHPPKVSICALLFFGLTDSRERPVSASRLYVSEKPLPALDPPAAPDRRFRPLSPPRRFRCSFDSASQRASFRRAPSGGRSSCCFGRRWLSSPLVLRESRGALSSHLWSLRSFRPSGRLEPLLPDSSSPSGLPFRWPLSSFLISAFT